MKKICISLLICILFSSNLYAYQSDVNRKGFDSITQEDLMRHLSFLASDEMRGRETAQQESRITAVYVVTRFEHLGLKPAGDNTTYMQNIKIRRAGVDPDAADFSLHLNSGETVTFDFGDDFIINNGTIKEPLPVVFAGYGLDSDNYSDYKNIDVSGKIVLCFSHTPQEGQMDGMFHDPRYSEEYNLFAPLSRRHGVFKSKQDIAKDKGAAGIIIVENPNHTHENNYEKLKELTLKRLNHQRSYSLNLQERTIRSRLPLAWISESTAFRMFQSSGTSLYDIQREFDKTVQPNSFEMEGITVSFSSTGEESIKTTRNVVGVLEGSDPQLKEEVVIIGGHYDHIEYYTDFMTGEFSGKICNGADDDASGTVAVLEIAEAFSENKIRPKRSIVFVAFAAEEKGLLGSSYYAENPVIPLEKTAAMINMDMLGRNEDIKNLPPMFRTVFGFNEQPYETAEDNKNAVNILGTSFCTGMKDIAEKNNRNIKLNLKFRYDNKPNLIRASDHAPFLMKGIPVMFFSTGLHADLHAPGDDVEKINFPKMERIVKLIYLSLWELADTEERLKLDKSL